MLEGRVGSETDVQRPWKASAVEVGTGGRRDDYRERDQGRRRASAHEAPALGDLGDELARTMAGSVVVAECSDFAGRNLLHKRHMFEA